MRLFLVVLSGLVSATPVAETVDIAPGVRTSIVKKPPHIVALMSDDLGWNNIGFHNPAVHSPELDALRADGIELTRHYAYKYCSPTRSSFLSGRLPVHVNEVNEVAEAPLGGIHPNMTTLPRVLKQAGYISHHVGKWHAGMASRAQVPVGRGFASSLGYFFGQEDHYTQQGLNGTKWCKGVVDNMPAITDLWLNEGPASKINGTDYSMNLYRDRALSIIDAHDTAAAAAPLFLFVAFANNHEPLQVPEQYLQPYPDPGASATQAEKDWRTYQGMITAADTAVGSIVDKLKEKGMYDNTLLVWFADNGGPIYGGGGANNYPLRGGKVTDFEGGIRVNALVSGGAVPVARRNSTYDGVTHVADWLATFADAAGLPPQADAAAAAASLPPFDSLSLMGAIQTGAPSPRAGKLLVISSNNSQMFAQPPAPTVVVVMDQWKAIFGSPIGALWTGPSYPNASGYPSNAQLQSARLKCGDPTKSKGAGCLFNVVADPSEHSDVAKQHPDVLAKIIALLKADAKTWYNPDRGCRQKSCVKACCDAAIAAGGFWSPYLP